MIFSLAIGFLGFAAGVGNQTNNEFSGPVIIYLLIAIILAAVSMKDMRRILKRGK